MIWVILAAAAFALLAFAGANVESIATYARNAGFSGDDLVTAVAIAYAESSGDPKAEGDWMVNGKLVPKGTQGAEATSYGLFQIHWTVHRDSYVAEPSELFDPQRNANYAFLLYTRAGQSFTDWSTFNGGRYTAYLDKASQEVNA